MIRRCAVRADASPAIGGGHVMRCLALAGEIRRRGGDVVFLADNETAASVPALAASGFAVCVVAGDPAAAVSATLAHFGAPADWIIVDSYAIDAAQDLSLRGAARHLMVIDDLANRPRDCDLLLDQNLGRGADDYRRLVPGHCNILAGAAFAMLRPEFALARPAALARRAAAVAAGEPVRRILVSLGMTDVGGITECAVRAVIAAATGAAIDVALGSRAPSLAAVRALARERGDIVLHVDTADMCQLIAAADLAVGAAGSTSWERCCLGLPAVMLVLAENQRPIAAQLAARGAATVLDAATFSKIDAASEIHRLASRADTRANQSRVAAALIDGAGTRRVVDLLADEPAPPGITSPPCA